MKTDLDIRRSEFPRSRLCHELVSPVGAINNGVELIEEMGADMADEAIGLIAHSADRGIAPPAPAASCLWSGRQ